MDDARLRTGEEPFPSRALPIGSPGRKSSGWYGMMMLITTEASLFVYLLFSYFYFAIWSGGSFLPSELPKFNLSAPDTAILLLSSVVVWWGEKGARKGSHTQLSLGLLAGIVLGTIFVGVQIMEWADKPYQLNTSSYSSLYFIITGFHMVHVVVGMLILLALLVWSLLGYFDRQRHAPVVIGAIYWHFVDAVWIAVFFTIYVSPHLG
ncbi:cytochrome c oxidase subunit 3 [Devosia algicola]|uniref:Cytochrome c oxidase subunit 3 n=1 Tax=Devosia algicola TaxID=3026418 RepID=A0ABY7YLS1_9HYPH|nr:cytochrome c oxidase subunit 3 [Devosia algicola]WDR02208.1 cytochrome c oxidase subunit 3 [Devosia algicola]